MYGLGAMVVKKVFSIGCIHRKLARWVTTPLIPILHLRKLNSFKSKE